MTGGCSMAAMIFKGPPQWGQCSSAGLGNGTALDQWRTHLPVLSPIVPKRVVDKALSGGIAVWGR